MARECGSCTACCIATFVPELGKVEGVLCPHCLSSCTIYDSRPTSCRTYECLWLKGDLKERDRPDKVHFLLERLPGVPVILALMEKGYQISAEMTALFKGYKDAGIAVVSGKQALLPKGMTAGEVEGYVISAAKKLGVIK